MPATLDCGVTGNNADVQTAASTTGHQLPFSVGQMNVAMWAQRETWSDLV